MKKLLASLATGVLAAGVIAGPAMASAPVHDRFEPYTGVFHTDAGELCDFEYLQIYTEKDTFTTYSDGRVMLKIEATDTNWNLTSGAPPLTEKVTFQITDYPDLRERQVGVFWKLRGASGAPVVVHAGQLLFETDFNLVKMTPNSDPGFTEVVCKALGGNPAS